jgi:hypothetical protein
MTAKRVEHIPGETDYGADQPPRLTEHPDLIKAWIERWFPDLLDDGLEDSDEEPSGSTAPVPDPRTVSRRVGF